MLYGLSCLLVGLHKGEGDPNEFNIAKLAEHIKGVSAVMPVPSER